MQGGLRRVGERRVESVEQGGSLAQRREHGGVGLRERADAVGGHEHLPARDDGDEGAHRSSHPLGCVEQSGDLDVDLDDDLVVVGRGLLELASQPQQRRQLGRQDPRDEVGDDGRREVQCREQPVEEVLDRHDDRVRRAVLGRGPHDRVVRGQCGEHPGGDVGSVVTATDDEVGAHGPLRPRRAS